MLASRIVMAGTAVDRLPRVLFVLSSATPTMPDGKKSGWYWSELYYPYEEFTKAGCTCDAVSLTGTGSPDENSVAFLTELMMMEVAAMTAWRKKTHPIHQMLANLRSPSEINPSSYSIIYFVGGHACLFDLPTAQPIHEIAAKIYEAGGIVAAVCHGPAVFQGLHLSDGTLLIKGKNATGFTVEEEEKVGAMEWMKNLGKPTIQEIIEQAGGNYSQADLMKEHVVVSDRVLTGQNPTSAGALASKCISVWNSMHPNTNSMSSGSTFNTMSSSSIMSSSSSSSSGSTFNKDKMTNYNTLNDLPNMAYIGDGVAEPSMKQKCMLEQYTDQAETKQ